MSELFVSRGHVPVREGQGRVGEIGNADADGHVIIDAVQFLPVKE